MVPRRRRAVASSIHISPFGTELLKNGANVRCVRPASARAAHEVDRARAYTFYTRSYTFVAAAPPSVREGRRKLSEPKLSISQ
jgi:hypothetical protein